MSATNFKHDSATAEVGRQWLVLVPIVALVALLARGVIGQGALGVERVVVLPIGSGGMLQAIPECVRSAFGQFRVLGV